MNVKFIIIFGLFSFSYMYINSLHSNPLVFSILLTIPSDFDLLEVVSLNPLTWSHGDWWSFGLLYSSLLWISLHHHSGIPFSFLLCHISISQGPISSSFLVYSLSSWKRCMGNKLFLRFCMSENFSPLPSLLIDSLAGYIILGNEFLSEFWRHCFIVVCLPLLLQQGQISSGGKYNEYQIEFLL